MPTLQVRQSFVNLEFSSFKTYTVYFWINLFINGLLDKYHQISTIGLATSLKSIATTQEIHISKELIRKGYLYLMPELLTMAVKRLKFLLHPYGIIFLMKLDLSKHYRCLLFILKNIFWIHTRSILLKVHQFLKTNFTYYLTLKGQNLLPQSSFISTLLLLFFVFFLSILKNSSF